MTEGKQDTQDSYVRCHIALENLFPLRKMRRITGPLTVELHCADGCYQRSMLDERLFNGSGLNVIHYRQFAGGHDWIEWIFNPDQLSDPGQSDLRIVTPYKDGCGGLVVPKSKAAHVAPLLEKLAAKAHATTTASSS